MTLDEIFKNKDLGEFRQKKLLQDEMSQVIELLNQAKGIIWFKPYMKVKENLPEELLKPILLAGIKLGNVSYPKTWMPDLIRIYSQEKIDASLFEIINQSSFRDKCKSTSLFYWNKFSKIIRYKDGEPHEELGVIWKWNGKGYVEEYVKTNLEQKRNRNKSLKSRRYNFLIQEFKKYNNIVYRYFIALELPKSIDEFPEQLKETAKEVVEVISKEDFPTWVNPLKEQVKGNSELENLLFEELKWQKK